MARRIRVCILVGLLSLLGSGAPPDVLVAEKPKLVVVISIDQFRYDFAPTLSALLHMSYPAGTQGRVLGELVK